MTGFEYTAALALIQSGARAEGIQAISEVRQRHDGQRRNPFDETECGHHYARAMASWGAVAALTGLRWSAHTGEMHLHRCAVPTTGFFAVGCAWGLWHQQPVATGTRVQLRVLGGHLPLRRIFLDGSAVDVSAGAVDIQVPL